MLRLREGAAGGDEPLVWGGLLGKAARCLFWQARAGGDGEEEHHHEIRGLPMSVISAFTKNTTAAMARITLQIFRNGSGTPM